MGDRACQVSGVMCIISIKKGRVGGASAKTIHIIGCFWMKCSVVQPHGRKECMCSCLVDEALGATEAPAVCLSVCP